MILTIFALTSLTLLGVTVGVGAKWPAVYTINTFLDTIPGSKTVCDTNEGLGAISINFASPESGGKHTYGVNVSAERTVNLATLSTTDAYALVSLEMGEHPKKSTSEPGMPATRP